MSGWAAKRFWTEARAEPEAGGFAVWLDARQVKTPQRRPLIVPTQAMAEAVAVEWNAQVGPVRPETMPVTRAANAALDKVGPQFDEVAGLIAAYGATDLLCYRAEGPDPLVVRQAAGWNPVLAWCAEVLDAPLLVTTGVMHVRQPEPSLDRLTAEVTRLTPFELTGFHDLVAISGSLVLALAVLRGRLDASEAWSLSRIDEHWQAEVWGRDDDAEAAEAVRCEGFLQAERFCRLCR